MKKKPKVIKIIEKGKELWDQHGETVIGVVKKIQSNVSKKTAEKIDGETEFSGRGLSTLLSDTDSVEDIMVLENDNDVEMAEVVEDEDFFHSSMDKLSESLSAAAESGFSDPQAVADALSALVEVASDTVKYVAEQETKQEEIRAQRDVAIARINATSACIKEYLEKTFDERSAIFAKQFECVDVALRTGNNEMLAMSLNSINSLAASSPFKNLADINQVQQALGDRETEWDI